MPAWIFLSCHCIWAWWSQIPGLKRISWIWEWMNWISLSIKMRAESKKLRNAISKRGMRSRKSRRYAKSEPNNVSMFRRRLIVSAILHMGVVSSLIPTLIAIWSIRVYAMMLNLTKRKSPYQAPRIRTDLQARNPNKSAPRSFPLLGRSTRLFSRATLSINILRKS